jgi:hypothetical protein
MVMLRGISDLKRFSIAGADGNLGNVGDVYFDDRNWSVRYLAVEADTGLCPQLGRDDLEGCIE